MDFPSHYFIKILLIRGCILPQQSLTQSHPPDRPGPSPPRLSAPASCCQYGSLLCTPLPGRFPCTVSPPASGTGPRPYGLSGFIRQRLRLWFRFLSGTALALTGPYIRYGACLLPGYRPGYPLLKKQRLPPYKNRTVPFVLL